MSAAPAKRAKPARQRKPAKKKPRLKAAGRQNAVKEWIGATPDSRAPPTVLQRIFMREGGICYLTGLKIDGTKDQYDFDHKKRLEDGGENRESNLFPVLRHAHRQKTAEETKRAKKADRVQRAHLGIKDEPARPLEGRGFKKTVKEKPTADPFPHLPKRRLFTDG